MVNTVAKDKGFVSDGPINPVPAQVNAGHDQFPTTPVRSQGLSPGRLPRVPRGSSRPFCTKELDP